MLFYNTPLAPNPRRVRIFLAEKNVTIPTRDVNLLAQEHKKDAYSAVNALEEVPALVLDDGAVLTESVAICRYIESLYPEPALLGRDAREQASSTCGSAASSSACSRRWLSPFVTAIRRWRGWNRRKDRNSPSISGRARSR